jgi:Uma2 family endonuclease
MRYARPVTPPFQRGFTENEYLALESASETRHEFVDGAIVAMAGGRPPHNALAVSIGAALHALVQGRSCAVLSSDQRVHVPATGLYTYPDITVACGERQYKDDNPPSLLNPTLLVEVTSETTEDFDRGRKFLHYQGIASLREYLIVSHRERRLDHYRRLDSGQWLATAAIGGDAEIELLALGGRVRVGQVYADIDLSEGARPR